MTTLRICLFFCEWGGGGGMGVGGGEESLLSGGGGGEESLLSGFMVKLPFLDTDP